MIKLSLHKLQKFLKLEAERGYDNRAVVGGFERMLSHWEAEARAENLSESLLREVSTHLRNYASLDSSERATSLSLIWDLIQKESGEVLPTLEPPPAEIATQAIKETPPVVSQASPSHIPSSRAPRQQRYSGAKGERTPSSLIADGNTAALNAPITVLPGVGPKHGQTLERLGLRSLGDMLYFFPRRYDDYSQLKTINRLWFGEVATVIGTVDKINARIIRSGRFQIVEAVVSDGSGFLRITWFNQPWIAKRLEIGMEVVLSGKVDQYLGRLVMNNPEVEPLEQEHLHTNRIVPVYPLTANITQRWLRKMMHQVVNYWAPRVRDLLPEAVLKSEGLLDLSTALLQAHFPTSEDQLKRARLRLAFDEIFFLQLGVLRQKQAWQSRIARLYSVEDTWLKDQVSRLPFVLTSAQQRALADVRSDLLSGHPMNRLLQGDVGSGKTIIAALAVAIIAQHGAQSAVMAPTSILAEQHYRNFHKILSQQDPNHIAGPQNESLQPDGAVLRPDQISLLIGSTPESEKSLIREGLASGTTKLVIGTHALIEDPITFSDLQFVVVDEQHRFGVEQRAILRSKGSNPHLLVMTATPIPRSLALTVYGDLDLSVMDEMPPGRIPVETQVFYPRERERAYAIIRNQVEMGHQAFMIYPLIEEGENSDTKAAVEEYTRLQEIFPKNTLGLLHGRLRADEKENVMAQFRDGKIQILVSTSVVEVGMDIPNATVMLVEGANRFGLAQLHQFRGRVGRGQDQSYCILIPETADAIENERLTAMTETQNGFILAERDLEQRGPGDFLGERQSGFHSELRFASLTDVHLIEKARRQAQEVYQQDPDLTLKEHSPLKEAMTLFWGEGQGDIS